MITLYNGNEKIILPVTDDSYSYNSVMGENSLTLYFSSEKYIKIPVGSYCDFAGERYSLKKDSNFTKEGTRKYEYTLLLETDQSDLKLWKIRNTVDNRIKFSYTATPREHLELFVANANRRSSGWKVGECVEGKEVTFEYNHTYILDGLNDFANQIGTEWQIINKTVHLRKVEYNKSSPLVLSYGKGNGFKTGVGRESGDIPVEIILVQGTDRNIDFSKYGSKELLLPKSQTLTYEGRTYKSSSDGLSVMRADKALTTGHEDSLDCSEIYPSRVGTVSSVIEVNAEDSLYDFIDNSIPDSLDFEDYLIDGENMTVIFQTGMLSGSDKEFEVKYYHKPITVQGKTKPGKRFEIVPQEIDGITMPDGKIYTPQPGDSYAVFGIQLPDSYICDNKTQTGASWDMFREAAKFLYEHEDKKFTFTGTLDGIWAKKRWLQIGGKIILGGYVLFSDEHFMPEGSLIRITGVKRYVNQPYKPEIELSNTTVGASISSELNKPGQNEVVIEDRYKDALKFTKRRFRDAKETMGMLEDALLNFSEAINPVAVQTMQLLVGDESLQFRFVNSKTNPVTVNHVVTYDKETMVLHCPAGIIQHMTLGINTLSASHKANEYKYWDISEYNSPSLFEPEKKYYLYIKANKSASAGSFLLSETAIKLEQVQGYYHFLTGILNSEYEGERSFVTLYGFSEILPGRVTTDKIVSTDGNTYFDLLKGIISGKITFKSGSSGLYELSEWGDVNNLITQAQNTANTAVESAKNANTAVGNLNNYVNGAFADGIITEAEAKAIEKYINTVNNTKAAVEAAYNKLYTNAYLTGTAKTGLLNAKVTLMGSIENLISAINSAIADGRTTVTEKNNVDNKYATFNSAYADFNTAVEVANKAIQDKLKGYSDEYSQKFDEFIGGSFKDLKDNAVLKQTIIEGGYLKNDLIDTNNLIVKKVFSKDGKFKILDDGSMEGTSGTFFGYLKTNFHLVEESDAIYTKDSSQGQYGYKINKELNLKVDMDGESNGATIILPNEIQYIGSRVILHNGCYPPYTRTVGSIRYSSVCIDDGGQLRGTSSNSSESDLLSWADPNKITWINGVIELIGIIEKGTYSPSLLSWKGQSNKAIPNPSNGYMYYNTEKNRNYVYWFGQWNEITTHENSPIIWKGKLDQAPENPEKNWVYISRYDSVFIYNGIRWEDISYYVITAEKCGWSVLSMSGVSLEYTRY